MIDEWENVAKPEPEETDPVRSKIDEFDQALQTKIDTLRERKEEFRELNLEAELGIISAENEVLYHQMKIELKELEEEIELLKHERKAIDKDLFTSPERHTFLMDSLMYQMIWTSKHIARLIGRTKNPRIWPVELAVL